MPIAVSGAAPIFAVFALLLASIASAQDRYTPKDAQYVTSSRNPSVLRYIVCLEGAYGSKPRSMSETEALDSAADDCRSLGRRLGKTPVMPNADDILASVRECGFRPGDARPGARCGQGGGTAAGGRPKPPGNSGGTGVAGTGVPAFRDYPARVYTGRVRAPDLSSHPEARTYRSRLTEAAKGKVNFAGEYILTYWGCGTTCLMGTAISVRTGRVHFLPGTVCCWEDPDANPIDHQADSNLIVFTGLINEEEPMAEHFYEFSGGRFQLIERRTASTSRPGGGGAPQQPQEALVCYYGPNGNQSDADSCKLGRDLSEDGVAQLGARCWASSGAYCDIGSSGQCQPRSKNYSFFSVFDRDTTDRCPATYRQAGGTTPGTPRPAPDGFDIRQGYDLPGGDYARLPGKVSYDACLSSCRRDSQCNGFTYNTGKSVCFLKWRGENWTPYRNAISGIRIRNTQQGGTSGPQCERSCDAKYDRCIERVAQTPNADETHYKPCSDEFDSCKAGCAINRGDCYTYEDGATVCP